MPPAPELRDTALVISRISDGRRMKMPLFSCVATNVYFSGPLPTLADFTSVTPISFQRMIQNIGHDFRDGTIAYRPPEAFMQLQDYQEINDDRSFQTAILRQRRAKDQELNFYIVPRGAADEFMYDSPNIWRME